ncbi:PAN domain-containing protein [Penicillium freii]|nr:PAN domain-containing protein [Penicillium freii]
MKFLALRFLPFCASLVTAQSSRPLYRELCPIGSAGTSGTGEFDNGQTYEYLCDVAPKPPALPSERLPATNPQACASLCAERGQGCKMSTWVYNLNTCNIFGAETETQASRGTILINVPQQPDSGAPTTCENLETALRDCQLSEEELLDELRECQERPSPGEEPGDCEDLQDL